MVEPSAPMGKFSPELVSNSPTRRSRLPSPSQSQRAGAANPCFSVSTGRSPAITRNGCSNCGAPGTFAPTMRGKRISSAQIGHVRIATGMHNVRLFMAATGC